MRIYDFVDEGLGHKSYLVDIGDGTTALVDPPRFPSAHETLTTQLGSRIAWTFDTHSHADYVTGSPGLAARLGATFVAPTASRLETPHRGIIEGDSIDLGGSLSMVAMATPGHTPDHHAYLLMHSGDPIALFSGGSLMVGTVGRTDLCGPELTDTLAHDMFRSLRRFDDLPDDLAVYPTHGPGSFCSAPGASQHTTTIGHERATNPLFAITDEDQFVDRLLTELGAFPTYFARLPELNRLGPHRYDTVPHLARLAPDHIERHLATGGALIDVRNHTAFANSHVPGSVSNTLRAVFATWTGWLVEPERPIAFVIADTQNRDEAVRQCLDVGHEHLVGELAGGIEAWVASGRHVDTIELVHASGIAGPVIDVRQANEYQAGHIPGAVNVELGSIANAELPTGVLTVMCGHGERAMTAASLLATKGRRDLLVLDGGPDTWTSSTGIALASGP
jgi:hydroxyacylglutathione hydrolase